LKDKFIYGYVGRIVDRKGISELYYAFEEIYSDNPNARLLIVGRPFWDQIRDRSIITKLEEHPGTILVGFQTIEMVPYFLSAMDVFVLPAHWEGFGNVLIQAAALGLPIIATDVTGCKDAVRDGFNGVLIPDKSHNRLVAEMKDIAENHSRRKTMGTNGIIWSKNFEPKKIWDGYMNLYEETYL